MIYYEIYVDINIIPHIAVIELDYFDKVYLQFDSLNEI